MANEYLILPGCDDTNRGDQALIWETVEVAKSAGFSGHYSMIATEECGRESQKIGISSLPYLLPHPSMHAAKDKQNISYGIALKLKWALRAVLDLLIAFPLSKKATRPLAAKLLSKEQKKTLAIYQQAKAAFVKGGGFLHAYDGLVDTYKIYFFLYHINLALSMGIPVYVMPNSYGPFVTGYSRRLVKKCLSRCRLVYSRESASQQVLKADCGIDSHLSRDLAMYLEKDASFDAVSDLASKGISLSSGKTVGITVRPYRFPGKSNAEELYQDYKHSVEKLILWLLEEGYHPVLIEHVFSENHHEQDMICIQEIADMIKASGKTVPVYSNRELNCRQLKTVYSKMDYVVGTRFHSVIFSLTEKVPVMAITYGGNKGTGIMHDLGLSDFAISIESISGKQLIETFRKLVSERSVVLSRLEENQHALADGYRQLVSELRSAMK